MSMTASAPHTTVLVRTNPQNRTPFTGDNKFKLWKKEIALSVVKNNGQLWIISIWIFMAAVGHATNGRGQAERCHWRSSRKENERP